MLQTTDSQMTAEPAPIFQFDGVRVAQTRDEDAVLDVLLHELHEENALFPANPDKVMRNIRFCTREKRGIIGLIEGHEGIEATIGLQFSEWWYSDDLCINELWNHVRKPYRRTSHAKNMLGFAKRISDHFSLPLHIGIISNVRTKSKVRLYGRSLPYAGAFFFYQKGHET